MKPNITPPQPPAPPRGENPGAVADAIRVTVLRGRRDFQRFIDVAHLVYADDPKWIPPLHQEIRKLIDEKLNPFFDHGEACFWIAWRGNDPVGRISAQINRLHLDIHKDATGNFGFLEAIDDQEVFHALLTVAEEWLRERGIKRILGPYSLSMNDEIGVLVSGFESPPMVMMGHAPVYYSRRLEIEGYRKAKDVHAYLLDLDRLDSSDIERVQRATSRLRTEGRLAVRFLDRRRFDEEMRLVLDIYNDAWSENWGFLPIEAREAAAMIASVKPIIRSDGVVFSLVDGRPEAVIVSLPNINEVIADLGGRLLPFGWAKLLWRLWRRPPRSERVILAGVRKSYRDSVLSGAFVTLLLGEIEKGYRKAGIKTVEFSWILEDNKASLAIARSGAKLSKVYRIYQKSLSAGF